MNLHYVIAIVDGLDREPIDHAFRVFDSTPREGLDPLPLLTGDDLVAAGWLPGPKFKTTLDRLRAAQLDGEATSRDAAWDFVKNFQK